MIPHVKAGRVLGLAVTTAKRIASLPDMPTVSEAGVPGYEIAPWGGIMAPKGLSKDILARLNHEFNVALKTKTIQDTYAAAGLETIGGPPEKFTDFLRREMDKWGTLIKRHAVKG